MRIVRRSLAVLLATLMVAPAAHAQTHVVDRTALAQAVPRAKTFVWHGLQAGLTLGVGRGRGPVDHLFAIRRGASPA